MLCVSSVTSPAAAHPHIFAKYDVSVAPKDADTYVLHFTFKIHNVVIQHPLFRDPQLLEGDLLSAIQQHPFALFLEIDGKNLDPQNVDLVRVGGSDSEPVYSFETEVPASAKGFGFSIYDTTYYDEVSLASSDALTVAVPKLTCTVSREEVGKTMWGPNMASHVSCGDDKQKMPLHKFDKFPDENLGGAAKPSDLDGPGAMP